MDVGTAGITPETQEYVTVPKEMWSTELAIHTGGLQGPPPPTFFWWD
jgi:hypothetical protein